MTIKDIARLSGYAVGTVSRVLNGSPNVSEAARNAVEDVVRQYDFKLNNNAKHLRQQAHSGIAVIIKGTHNMLFAAIVEEMQSLVREMDISMNLYYIDEYESEVEQAIRICAERRPLGIAFLGSNLEEFRRRFAEVSVPCVLVTNSAAEIGFSNLSSVTTDDAAGAEMAVSHLIGLGHTRIGILGGKMTSSNAASTRYAGCLRAFAARGVPFRPETQLVMTRFSLTGGYEAMQTLLETMPDITAVFAMSDVMAVGAIRAVREKGLRVPEDISIVGYDGIEMGRFLSPRLTTISQQQHALARRSLEILLSAIRKETAAVHEITPFRLMEGESVCKK